VAISIRFVSVWTCAVIKDAEIALKVPP